MISIIVAQSRNGIIGNRGKLPWEGELPADMKRFRDLTTGHPVIMGRRTYESLPDKFRPLPKRTNIVLSRRPSFDLEPPHGVVGSLGEAVKLTEDQDPFVIGGGEVYLEALPVTDRVYLTIVDRDFVGDVVFPVLDESEWTIVSPEPPMPPDASNRYGYQFVTYERIR